MIALAQDFLAAGIALAVYVAGVVLVFGRCRRLAPPPTLILSLPSNDNRHAMRTQQPAREPTDITAISIAAGMGAFAVLCALALLACARAHGVM